MKKLKMIFAVSKNGAIGIKGDLPWHIPEDLTHFKNTTMGSSVIMGRKTWESIEDRFKPLVGRVNIVLTKQNDYKVPEGVHVVHSLEEAVSVADRVNPEEAIWVIGGGELYKLALPFVDHLCITQVDTEVEGDAFAPHIEWSDWVNWSSIDFTSSNGMPYQINRFVRKGSTQVIGTLEQTTSSIVCSTELLSKMGASTNTIKIIKPVGYWSIGANPDNLPTYDILIYFKPTQEQIDNTEKAFGWKWVDLQQGENNVN